MRKSIIVIGLLGLLGLLAPSIWALTYKPNLPGYSTAADVAAALDKAHDSVTINPTVDALFSLSGQVLGYQPQTANYVLAGPLTGDPAVPTFRALTVADISDLSTYSPISIGTANGLSIETNQLSLALATSTTSGAMSASQFNALAAIDTSAEIAALLATDFEPLKGANDNFVTDTDVTKLSLLPSFVTADSFMVTTSGGAVTSDTSVPVDIDGFNPLMVTVTDAAGKLQSHSDVTVTELLTAANGADAGKGTFESRLSNLESTAGTGQAFVYPGSESMNTIAVTISTGNLVNSLIPVWLSDTNGGAATSTAFDGDGGDGWVVSDATVFSTAAADISETILTGPDGDAIITMAHSNASSPVTKYLCAEYKGEVECDAITFSADSVTYERIIDNTDAGFSYVGTFYTSTGDPGYYGTNYRYSQFIYGDSATWTFDDIPSDGTYELFVQYPIGSNYDNMVRYTIVDSAQTQYTSYIDMNEGGGSMRSMGTFSLQEGTVAVTITWDYAYIAVDAVKIVAVP